MIFFILTLLVGLSISATAAYYSILGLITIFNAFPVAIAIMGAGLEAAKIVIATWLKKYWKSTPILMKTYLSIAVFILMCITSMGIFGFLSKAHVQQAGDNKVLKIEMEQVEFSISQEQEKITSRQHVLERLDEGLKIYFDKGFVTRGLKEREKQKLERESLEKEISDSQANVSMLMQKKMDIDKKLKSFEVEVGPVKYIATLFYSQEELQSRYDEIMENSIKAIIIALIFVFDPVAILLLLAANISFQEYRKNKKSKSSIKPLEASIKPKEETMKPDKEIEKEVLETPASSLSEEVLAVSEVLEHRDKQIEQPKKEITDQDIEKALNESIDEINSKIHSQVHYNISGEASTVLKNTIRQKLSKLLS